MLKSQPKLKVKEIQRIVVSETNYSKEQINSLFEYAAIGGYESG